MYGYMRLLRGGVPVIRKPMKTHLNVLCVRILDLANAKSWITVTRVNQLHSLDWLVYWSNVKKVQLL